MEMGKKQTTKYGIEEEQKIKKNVKVWMKMKMKKVEGKNEGKKS